MKTMFKKFAVFFVIILFTLSATSSLQVFAAEQEVDITLLLTSDMHSNIAEGTTAYNGNVVLMGGFARLATLIEEQRTENTLVLDAGDFSMGTLFQTLYTTKAPEIALMSKMGYDAIAIGNHEFDMGNEAFLSFLTAAEQYPVPLLASNLNAAGDNTVHVGMEENPLAEKGVKNYIIKEVGGKKVGIFSLIGKAASSYVFVEEYTFLDPVTYSKEMVKELKAQGADAIVLLSHCGTEGEPGSTEDEEIARQVEGIDFILSGHSHSFEGPIEVGNTVIFSPGANGAYLCKAVLTIGPDQNHVTATKEDMLPVHPDIKPDSAMQQLVEGFEKDIQTDYLDLIDPNLTMKTPIAYAPFTTEDMNTIHATLGNYRAGDIITDSFLYALSDLAGIDDIEVAIEPIGVVRAPFYEGVLTTSDLYNILSYGTSDGDKRSGSSLGVYYIKGEDFYDLCEVDVSISPMMGGAQLFYSGLEYDYVPGRLPFNKVSAVRVLDKASGEFVPVQKERLYKVAVTTSTANTVSVVGEQSFGLLDIKFYNEDGTPLSNDALSKQMVLYQDENGQEHEIKEWVALTRYLQSFTPNNEGLPEIPASYETARPAKTALEHPAPQDYFSHLNKVPLLLFFAIAILAFIVWLIIFLVRRHKKKKAGERS